jgi:2-keto-4-pentenoate hydratase
MSKDENIRAAAVHLKNARTNKQTTQRISDLFGISGVDEAYAVQEENTRFAISKGRRLIGRKIGLTNVAVQAQLGVDQPDFGMLFADMEFQTGAKIDLNKLIQPKIEGEIAFVLKNDINHEDVTLSELFSAIGYVLPALEIVDSAIEDWNITFADTVADNASSAFYVLGNTPTYLNDLDLSLEGMILEKNNEIASIGVGAACLGHPLVSCHWLVKKMVQFGRPLKAGDIVLSGALGPMVQINAGDYISLKLTRLGGVSCSFI